MLAVLSVHFDLWIGNHSKGICFGHQIISRALGCECVPNGGRWEVGITPVDLTDVGRQLFGTPLLVCQSPLLEIRYTHDKSFPVQQNIQQMHRDHIPEVPKSCHLLGSTSVTYNQGFIRLHPSSQPSSLGPSSIDLKDIQIFTVQGHPEFTKRIGSTIVDARAATGVVDKETAEGARSRADWPNHGVDKIGKVIWGIMAAKAQASASE